MKIEWLRTNVTAVGSPARVASDGDFRVFWPVEAAFVVGEPICDLETPS